MSGADFPGLDAYLSTEAARVEAALVRALDGLGGSSDAGEADAGAVADGEADNRSGDVVPLLRGPSLPPELVAAMRHGVLGGGKRLRPVLCVAAYRACGGEASDAAYDLAASLELIHAYSLMHDDLPCMDDAELRRGRATTHRVHGETTTMIAGGALIPAAALQALRAATALGADSERARRVAELVMEAAGAGGMVGGQWLDLLGEDARLTPRELDELHRLKTGALLTASLVVGATAAGAPEAARDALAAYGRAIGLAFQIADDILDATASAETLGKNPSDADLGKSTYVTLYGLDRARSEAEALVEEASEALREARVSSPPLEALARYVVERGK